MKRKAFAQIPLMIGLLIMAVAVPVATRLVQMNQDNRNKAASSTSGACTEGNLGTLCTNGSGKTCQLHRNSDCTTSCTDNCGAGFATIAATAYPSLVVPTTPAGATTRPGVATESPTKVVEPTCVPAGSVLVTGNCCSGSYYIATSGQNAGKAICGSQSPTIPSAKPTAVPTACTCIGGKWTGTVALCGHSLGYACTATCVAATCNSECITNGATSGSCNSSNQCMCSTVPTAIPTNGDEIVSPNSTCLPSELGQYKCTIDNGRAVCRSFTTNPVTYKWDTTFVSGCGSKKCENGSCTCIPDGKLCSSSGSCDDCCSGSAYHAGIAGSVYYCGVAPTVVPTINYSSACKEECKNLISNPAGYNVCYNSCLANPPTLTPTSSVCSVLTNKPNGCNCSSNSSCKSGYCDGFSGYCKIAPTTVPTIKPTVTPTSVGACSGASTDSNCKGLDPGAPCGAGKIDGSYVCATSSTVAATSGLNCTCTSTAKWVCCKTSTGLYALEPACSSTETLTSLSASKCVNPTAVPTTPRTTTNPSPTTKPTTKPTDIICRIAVGKVYTLNDFSIWRSEYVEGSYGSVSRSTWNSDFDCDGKVTLNDFSIWRTNYIKSL